MPAHTESEPPSPLADPASSPPSPSGAPEPAGHGASPPSPQRLAALTLGALGVVYGDIGTSPLYALRECFHGPHAIAATASNVLGVLSLIFWALLIVISLKYLVFVVRADNRGEGGILALMALTARRGAAHKKALIVLGIFGAALLYGDGVITPAISVLSAVEGLSVATHLFEPVVIPIALAILSLLFLAQRYGTGHLGRIFGGVVCTWFAVLALLGVAELLRGAQVLVALDPRHAARFFLANGGHGFLILGTVFLVVTGGEALYADMGHFGRRPIRIAWFAVVLPSLMLNYLGQGALLLRAPEAASNPFYLLAPPWALYPLVVLSTGATVIASQALISGAFSLTQQAIQLGYWPRMEVVHTSADAHGQIYLPGVNAALWLGVVLVVLSFGSSSALASAYGIAVTATMAITTVLAYVVARERWGIRQAIAAPVAALFFLVDLAFLGANALKVKDGGWFPLLLAAGLFTLMTTWKRGRLILAERLRAAGLPMATFVDAVAANPPVRVPGTAIFLTGTPDNVPAALLHNLKHNKVLHEQTIFLTIAVEGVPHTREEDRLQIEPMELGFQRVIAKYGFMESPTIADILKRCREKGLQFSLMATSFFLGRETLIPSKRPGMALWRESLFASMSRNARPATAFFRIPPNRVVELGSQVEL